MIRTVIVLCLLAGLSGLRAQIVREDAATLVYRQRDGLVVTLRKRPVRTVIAYASLAKVWYAAGGEAVAVPTVKSKAALPAATHALPEIGKINMINAEQVLLQKPDLVLLNHDFSRHRELATLLRGMGVDALCCEYDNYADYAELVELFAKLNGQAMPVGGHAGADEIAALCAKARQQPSPRVAIILCTSSGFALETPVSNTGYMARMLGATNVVANPEQRKVQFSYERFLLDNPDAIVIVPMGDLAGLQSKFRQELLMQPAWGNLAAAKASRVHFLPAEWFLFQAGPDYPQALRHLAALLYPGVDFDQ